MRIIILCILLYTNLTISQGNKIYVSYNITNNITGNPIYVKAALFIDNDMSLYKISPKDTKYSKKDSINYVKENNTITKINYETNDGDFLIITDKRKDTLKYTSNSGETKFLVNEKIKPFKWILHNETRKIGSFICNKATTYFRGRNYIAWYATKIPTNNGPWKFSGLPGLILEVYDFDKIFFWELESVIYPFKEKITIEIPNKKTYKSISLEDYVAMRSVNSKNYSRLLVSKMPKGSKARGMKIERTGIELIYEWEEETKEN